MYGIILFRELSLSLGRFGRKRLTFLFIYVTALIVELIVLFLKLRTQRWRSHTYYAPLHIALGSTRIGLLAILIIYHVSKHFFLRLDLEASSAVDPSFEYGTFNSTLPNSYPAESNTTKGPLVFQIIKVRSSMRQLELGFWTPYLPKKESSSSSSNYFMRWSPLPLDPIKA